MSLTCIPCRVMESVIKDVMTKYLESESLMSACQHGFRKMHSTGLQILECINDLTLAVDMGNNVDVCYIDFSRAFDTVSIPKLLYKMSAYGFRGKLLKWLTDFFLDRKFCVKINNVLSETVVQTSGIAQGTSLGPLSFSIYINDLPLCLRNCVCKLFADDAKVYYVYRPMSSTDDFQNDLHALASWADLWQLTIAVKKTFMLYLGKSNQRRDYSINGINIAAQDVIRDLGIQVTSDLNWHSHCVDIARKANITANAILHSFVCKDVEVYMNAFYSYVRPILEFNCYVWLPTLCMDIDLIENVQKCFTRRVFLRCNMPRLTYLERLSSLNCDTLEKRRLHASLYTFYNIYNKHVSCNILENCKTGLSHLRGNSCRLFISFCKTSMRKNFFVSRMIPLWNVLPEVTVKSNVSTAFRLRLSSSNFDKCLRFV